MSAHAHYLTRNYVFADKVYMSNTASLTLAGLAVVLILSCSRESKADAVDRVIAIDNNARVWGEQHASSEFRANATLRGCADNRGDYAECKVLGSRLELLAAKTNGPERLALEILGDIVLKNAAGMEMQAEPDGLTDGAIAAIVGANDAAQKKRLRIMVRDAKGLHAAPIMKYLEAFPPDSLPN
jgi:hypothetical protein